MYESSSQVPDHIWGFAKKYILEFHSALIACSQSFSRLEGKWIASPPGVFKINVNGATFEIDRNSSVELLYGMQLVIFMLLAVNIFRVNT